MVYIMHAKALQVPIIICNLCNCVVVVYFSEGGLELRKEKLVTMSTGILVENIQFWEYFSLYFMRTSHRDIRTESEEKWERNKEPHGQNKRGDTGADREFWGGEGGDKSGEGAYAEKGGIKGKGRDRMAQARGISDADRDADVVIGLNPKTRCERCSV